VQKGSLSYVKTKDVYLNPMTATNIEINVKSSVNRHIKRTSYIGIIFEKLFSFVTVKPRTSRRAMYHCMTKLVCCKNCVPAYGRSMVHSILAKNIFAVEVASFYPSIAQTAAVSAGAIVHVTWYSFSEKKQCISVHRYKCVLILDAASVC
jgi:hypothetical protein